MTDLLRWARPSSTRRRTRFSSAESFAWFIAGLDALYTYVDTAERPDADRAKLDRTLRDAIDWLTRVVDRYPRDTMAATYLTIAQTIQNHRRVAADLEQPSETVASGEAVAAKQTPESEDTTPLDQAITTTEQLRERDAAPTATGNLNLAQMYAKRDKGQDLTRALALLSSMTRGTDDKATAGSASDLSPDETKAFAFQCDVLEQYVRVRLSLRRTTDGSLDEAGRKALAALAARAPDAAKLPCTLNTRVQLEADYWTKVGFLRWEMAVARRAWSKANVVSTDVSAEIEQQLDEASKALLRALTAKPGWSLALMTLARVRYAQGHSKQAQDYLRQVTGVTAPDVRRSNE